MIAASWPRNGRSAARLLHVARGTGTLSHHLATALPSLLAPGDVLVVNDAATLPASLHGTARGHERIELRLLDEDDGTWRAVLFSGGNWRVPTERRPAPPALVPGDRLEFGALRARVEAVLPPSPRLLRVRFDATAAEFWNALYRVGRPVQYSYLSGPIPLAHVQNRYATRPWAAEAPSAGFVLDGGVLLGLLRRGVHITSLTHAAGLSATGDPELDSRLPLREQFDIPEPCVASIERARRANARVIAVGTTVVRALESRAKEHGGRLRPGRGSTALLLGPGHELQVVDGLLSGIHDPNASHYALLQAFAPRHTLERARGAAERAGYLEHEFGDSLLMA